MNEMNIYQRINAVIKEKIYIKRGSAGQGTGVLYDEVIAALQPLLTAHGIIVTTEKVGESRQRETKKGNYIYECDFNVTYINMDKPEDRFVNLVEAHAGDMGDKAPGKAITYAAKINMVKVFQIETGANDESRDDSSSNPISPIQAKTISDIFNGDTQRISVFCQNAQFRGLGDIPKNQYKMAVSAAKQAMGIE